MLYSRRYPKNKSESKSSEPLVEKNEQPVSKETDKLKGPEWKAHIEALALEINEEYDLKTLSKKEYNALKKMDVITSEE